MKIQKFLLVVLSLTAIVVIMIAFKPIEPSHAPAQMPRLPGQRTADNFVSELIYIKDPRTGLCFVCKPENWRFDSPLIPIAIVQEEKIPKELLVTAKVK